MKITVEVRQEHIDWGIPGDCAFCPVAKAMDAAGLRNPSVNGHGTLGWIDAKGKYRQAEMSESVCDFVFHFDHPMQRDYCQPFTFELEVA